MRRPPGDPWADWLASERAGEPDRADSALRQAFSAVPSREPSPDLAARVVRAARADRSWLAGRSEIWAAAGLALAALGLTAAPLTVIAALVVVSPGQVVTAVARACVAIGEWLSAGASVWSLLTRAGMALGDATMSPTGGLLLTMALLVASMALVVLNRYLPAERSS